MSSPQQTIKGQRVNPTEGELRIWFRADLGWPKLCHHLPCTGLSIGDWRVTLIDVLDMVVFHSPDRNTMTYAILNTGGERIIIEYCLSGVELLSTGKSGDDSPPTHIAVRPCLTPALYRSPGPHREAAGRGLERVRTPIFTPPTTALGIQQTEIHILEGDSEKLTERFRSIQAQLILAAASPPLSPIEARHVRQEFVDNPSEATAISGAEEDLLPELGQILGNMVILITNMTSWAPLLYREMGPDGFEDRVKRAVEVYAISLFRENTPIPLPSDLATTACRVARLVLNGRDHITRYICDVALEKKEASPALVSTEAALAQHLSIMIDNQPFRTLVSQLRVLSRAGAQTLAYTYQPWTQIAIRDMGPILGRPRPPTGQEDRGTDFRDVHLQALWNPMTFLERNYGSHATQLGSVVTITGLAKFAWATTCAEYMKKTWPESGHIFLHAMQRLFDQTAKGKKFEAEVVTLPDRSWFKVMPILSGRVQLFASASLRVSTDLTQQLAWLSSALADPPTDRMAVAHCNAKLNVDRYAAFGVDRGGRHFDDEFGEIDPILVHYEFQEAEDDSLCWTPLFSHPMIANGFPIPDRGAEVGLEIPIPLMMALAGASHLVEFEGGDVVKGFWTMLLPTSQDGGVVQWHLVSVDDTKERLSYQQGVRMYPRRLLLDHASTEDLLRSRAIVGWHINTECLLGHPAAPYQSLKYSKATEAGASFEIRGGSTGFQQFGLAQLDFVLGARDGRHHIRQKRPYERMIDTADKYPVALFSAEDKQCWLVPTSEVMLHIAQARNSSRPYCTSGGEGVQFTMRDTAVDTLLHNRDLSLSKDDGYTFQTMISEIWSILEALMDHKLSREGKEGREVRGPLQEAIAGYEFMAIVEEDPIFKLKRESIKWACRGWSALIRDTDTLALLANSFGDVLRPRADDTSVCKRWRTLPRGEYYMATTMKVLMGFYSKAGCSFGREFLTSREPKLRWHAGDSLLFQPCQTPLLTDPCDCDRVQQIVTTSLLGKVGKVVPPDLTPNLHANNAVIFGPSQSLRLRTLLARGRTKASVSDSPDRRGHRDNGVESMRLRVLSSQDSTVRLEVGSVGSATLVESTEARAETEDTKPYQDGSSDGGVDNDNEGVDGAGIVQTSGNLQLRDVESGSKLQPVSELEPEPGSESKPSQADKGKQAVRIVLLNQVTR